jgi:hypothetical protein
MSEGMSRYKSFFKPHVFMLHEKAKAARCGIETRIRFRGAACPDKTFLPEVA